MRTVKKPHTAWGRKVSHYLVDMNMSQEELALKSGVKLPTLRDVIYGRSVGIKLVPIVEQYMADNPPPEEAVT